MIEQVGRTFDLLTKLVENHPYKNDILSVKTKNDWVYYSVSEYNSLSHKLAYALLAKGYTKGDKVITICSNRPEWNIIDMGSNLASLIHIPVYPTLSLEDFKYIFEHSEAKLIFVGSNSIYDKLRPIIESLETKPQIALMDNSDTIECIRNYYDLGDKSKVDYESIVEDIKNSTSPNDIATIIYTSGTTGTPKGVMLSHNNLMFNSYAHAVKQTVNSNQRMLSFLPLCHIYERSMNYEYQYLGISIYYAESLGTIARDLSDCQAHGFCAVPRVLEMMYNKLESAGKNLFGIKKLIYFWAWTFGNNFDNYNKNPFYLLRLRIADKLVYSKWRENLGGNKMLVVSGGSSIQAKIVRLFNAAQLHIFEGYGMTEASPVISVNSPVQGFNIIGSVGKPIEGTELKLADDGEILTKGPHVMLGYYKDEKSTKNIIDDDGWLHTGDIGEFIKGGYLKITDRKKEIFKLSAGKYIAPQVIENLLRESSYISNCIVIGENEKFASAIITLDFERVHFWAAKHNISYENNNELIKSPKLLAKIHSIIENANKKLAPHEHIKRERIISDYWDINNKMLSQTLKLKRANIMDKYQNIITEIYKINK